MQANAIDFKMDLLLQNNFVEVIGAMELEVHFVDVEGNDPTILPIGESRMSSSTNSIELTRTL